MSAPHTDDQGTLGDGATHAARPARRRVARDLLFFFALAYAVSWALWSLLIALHLSAAPGRSHLGRVLYFAGIQGPCLAAILVSLRRRGLPQVRRLYATLVRPPFHPLWLLAAVAAFPSIALLATALAHLRDHVALPAHLVVTPPMGWAMLVVGQLLIMHGEEYGWRGFALPRLERLFGPLGGALVLGVLWACWHLVLFWTSGSWQSGSFAVYVVATVASCVVQAMLFFRAHRSTLAAMLFHGALNATQFVLDVPDAAVKYLPVAWGVAVLVALLAMPRPWFAPPRDGGAPEI